jgi:hypothetical protein
MSQLENAATVEYATTSRIAAARSLARAANVDVAIALRHLANGTAKTLIQSEVEPRKIEAGHLDRIRRLTDLRIRDAALRALTAD